MIKLVNGQKYNCIKMRDENENDSLIYNIDILGRDGNLVYGLNGPEQMHNSRQPSGSPL